MATINPSEEIDLLLRFPFSPKVREIIMSQNLAKKGDDYQTKHLKESYSPNEFTASYNDYNTPTKSNNREAISENNSPQTELAKMNARLEGLLVYSTPRAENKVESTPENYKYFIPSYSPVGEIHHVQNFYDTPIKEENILEKADRQLEKSRAIYSSNIFGGEHDLLKGDLKSSHVINVEDNLYESQIHPDVIPIIEEVKAKALNSGADENKTIAKSLQFE